MFQQYCDRLRACVGDWQFKVATSAQAQEAHEDIRKILSKAVSPTVAENTIIIYRGSVTAASFVHGKH